MKVWRFIDRSLWAKGEWDEEPDLWEFVVLDFLCRVERQASKGFLTAYMAVPASHSWYGKFISDICVHGGICWCGNFPPKYRKNSWCLSFHCGHENDLMPGIWLPSETPAGTYRSINFVLKELHNLAKLAHQTELQEIQTDAQKTNLDLVTEYVHAYE